MNYKLDVWNFPTGIKILKDSRWTKDVCDSLEDL